MNRLIILRAIVVTAGVVYLATGLALLFAPQWFFDNIGNFPPYNRHFLGDLGSFLLPLGVILLFAVRNPARHPLLIGFTAIGSVLHTFDHLYDQIVNSQGGWLQTIQLGVLAVVLLWAWWTSHNLSQSNKA